MKFTLRTLAAAAALLATGVMMAETPTVTQKWLTHDLISKGFETGDVRTGSGINGTAYISNGKSILTYDGTEVKTLWTRPDASTTAETAITVAEVAPFSTFTANTDIPDSVWTVGSYTFTQNKGTGSNDPAYNNSGKDIRIYAGGTFTATGSSSTKLTKIVFTLSNKGKQRLPAITASEGTIATQASGDETVTWTGEATSVTFTVGATADYGTDGSTKSGQFDFTALTVTGVTTTTTSINRGFALDEAGNIAVAGSWPTGATNWDQWLLVKADGSEATAFTLKAPTNSTWVGARTDLVGRAVGDFYSENGGLFYLTTAGVAFPIPVWISSGVQEEVEYATSATFEACNNLAYAQPRYSMDETSWDDAANAFYIAASNSAQIGYVNDDEEAAYYAWPTDYANMGSRFQNGFDVFELGDSIYAVHVFDSAIESGKNWGSNFAIWNVESGNILYQSTYTIEDGTDGITTGNGCSFVARKVNDYKVELYQCYCAGGTYKANSFNALYEITLTQPSLYLCGDVNSWSISSPDEFTLGTDGLYTFNYTSTTLTSFKLSTAKGDWTSFNAAALGVAEGTVKTGNTYNLVAGNTDNISIPAGTYVLTVDLSKNTLTITGEEAAFVAPTLYLRGEFNEWAYSDDTAFTNTEPDTDGNIVYTYTCDTLTGAFKIGSADWSYNYGYGAMPGEGTYPVYSDGSNMTIAADLRDITLKLTLNKDDMGFGSLVVTGTLYADLHSFAYDVKGEALENDQYKVTYKLTGAADKVDIVVNNADGEAVLTQSVTSPEAGENEATLDISTLDEGTYTWNVQTTSSNDNEGVAVGFIGEDYTEGENCCAGVVFMNDPEYDSYGYTVLGLGRAKGFAVYNPASELVGLYHKGFTGLTATNGSSVTRGDDLRNYAVFASWADASSGYWRLDVTNPEAEPVNMLMSDGATMASSGAVTLNGVAIGSGSPCVAFRGTGANTEMFAFDEDVYSNAIVRYNLGTAEYITEAPVWSSTSNSQFANTNIHIIPLENGYWVTQVRADINDTNVPAIMYFDNDNDKVWECAGNSEFANINGTSSGLAISPNGNIMAVSTYNDMTCHLLSLSMTNNEPTIYYMMSFNQQPSTTGYGRWAHMTFDAASNLCVYDRRVGKLVKYVLPGSATATTEAKAEYAISKESGVKGIEVGEQDSEAIYYNLQGIRMDQDNLTPGIYIRRQGDTTTKVVVK